MKPKKPARRFDHYRHDFEAEAGKFKSHVQAGLKSFRAAKGCAYRMAKAFVAITARHNNELLALARESGKSVDAWWDQWFTPMESLGDDYRDLIHAVNEGMTQAQYLAGTANSFLAAKSRAKRQDRQAKTAAEPLPAPPTGRMPTTERVELWKERARIAIAQLKASEAKLRQANRQLVQQERTIRKLQRLLLNTEKAAA